MVALIDSDVLIDYFTRREPFFENAEKIINMGVAEQFSGVISTLCLANVFYMIRKTFDHEICREMLLRLCEGFALVAVTGEMTVTALRYTEFTDYEDCIQSLCAKFASADYIITRNMKDFKLSEVKAISPNEFLEMSF
jgi:predicted nucleic acid-binding protein